MHPLLLPGSHLLRRDDGHDQVGLGGAVGLPGCGRTLAALTADAATMARLVRDGAALPDDATLRRALPAAGTRSAWPRHTVAALARRCPGRLEDALAGRAAHEVAVEAFGHPVAVEVARDVSALCRRTGLTLAGDGAGERPPDPGRQRVAVLVGVGEPRRELLDPLLHAGTPHLLVRLVEGAAVLGPLVVPGRTACLRCTDLLLAETDPAWPLLVEQYARAAATDRGDGIPEPVDAALATVAAGWAARDVASHAEGAEPTTWSATVRLTAGLEAVERREWPPHPGCGCTWA